MKALLTVALVAASIGLQGCATVFKGYYSKVELTNAPDSLRIFTVDGIELPVTKHISRNFTRHVPPYVWVDITTTQVLLRSKYDQILVLRHINEEKKVQVYGKLGAGWVVLGTVCGIVPLAIDAITGNWNSFDPIDASFSSVSDSTGITPPPSNGLSH